MVTRGAFSSGDEEFSGAFGGPGGFWPLEREDDFEDWLDDWECDDNPDVRPDRLEREQPQSRDGPRSDSALDPRL